MSNLTIPPDRYMEDYLDEEEIDLREYWRTIKKHRRSIVGIALLAGVFSTLISFAMDPIYSSAATVMIEANENKVAPIEEVYGFNPANREYLQTQFEILKSRKLVDAVINRLALEKHPEYDPQQSESFLKRMGLSDWLDGSSESEIELHEFIVENFTSHLSVDPVRNTQLVKVRFESKDPKLAQDVANTLAQVFIESGLEARVELTQQATKWLSSRLEQLRKKLTASESELKAYVATQPTGRFEALPEVVNHPVIQRIKGEAAEAQRKIDELSERYGPEHPKMIAARSDLNATQRNLRRELRKVTGALTADYAGTTNARQLEWSKSTDREIDLSSTFQKDSKLHTLQREMIADRQLYNLFLERIKETNLIGDIHNASARVVDPAVLPIKPIKPKKRLIVGLSIIMALFVGVMIAFLLEYLDNTLKTNVDVEEKLGLTTLGILPKLKTKVPVGEVSVPESMFIEEPRSQFAEAIRTIRTGVMLSALDDPHKIVLVTSSLPGEGKTTVSMNLAYALAHLEGKVLLIDGDMRKPSVGIKAGLPEQVAGLSDMTAGTTDAKECIHTSKHKGLDILPAGIVPPNPQELLSSKRFSELLGALSKHYNRIVIDTAPTNEVADALILSKQSSAVVYVTQADKTPYQLAQSGIRRLQQVGASIIGVVLNQLDFDKVGKWDSYGVYSGYYGGYGYGKEAHEAKLKKTA
ncbi:MAG: polysaccharide biosynthesis tyrosine autokinase [Gammaproteobacteria bacterium]|nr:polysaccharide biosynthesis tyrosine autokinase [Gammaproteobacteria bacterium]